MRGRNTNLTTYDSKAGEFSAQYDSVKTTDVLPGLAQALPRLRALDAFCGNGRDAEWLAQQGYVVDAMDGSHGMLREARAKHAHERVTYFHDMGPEFANTRQRGGQYDLIVMSAGWMHIAPERRAEALGNLLNVAKPGAMLLFSLRHGPAPADRPMFEVSVPELQQLAALNLVHAEEMQMPGAKADQLGRSNVWWQQVLLKVPQQNVDQLSLIRQSALQARMSSPHKPVLMYCLTEAARNIQPVDAFKASIAMNDVLPVWQRVYGNAGMPLWVSAGRPNTSFNIIRNGPLSHMADPATGKPLLQLERAADGTPHIMLPRSLADAIATHRDLIAAGSAAAVDRYMESRTQLDVEARGRFVSRMRPTELAAV